MLQVFFYYDHSAWLQNDVHDLNLSLIQDLFIQNMYNLKGLFARVQRERASSTEAQQLQYVGERFILSIQGMMESNKQSANKFGSSLGNQPLSCLCLQQNTMNVNHIIRPTSSLHYDAYYDNGHDSYDDEFTSLDLMSVQAGTDWRNLEHVWYQAIYGLDLSEAPKYQDDELYAYYNAMADSLQHGNLNFNKDCPCAVCGQAGHSFDDCSFLLQHKKVCKAYL